MQDGITQTPSRACVSRALTLSCSARSYQCPLLRCERQIKVKAGQRSGLDWCLALITL